MDSPARGESQSQESRFGEVEVRSQSLGEYMRETTLSSEDVITVQYGVSLDHSIEVLVVLVLLVLQETDHLYLTLT